jgi:hypothetical protein
MKSMVLSVKQIQKDWTLWAEARKLGYKGDIIWSDDNGKGKQATPTESERGTRTVRMGPYIWEEEAE